MKDVLFYIESLFGKKVFWISHLNIVFVVILFFLIGNVFTEHYIQIENQEAFLIDYLYQGILFVKLNILVLIIVFVQQTKVVSGILSWKTIEESRTLVITKYVISGLFIIVVLFSIFYVLFFIIGYYLTAYFVYPNYVVLYLRLLIFVIHSYLFVLLLYFINDSIYVSLSYLFLSQCIVLFGGFMVIKEEIGLMLQVILLYVSDLILFEDLSYSFLYSDLYQLSIIFSLFFLLVWRYNKIDL